METEMINEFEDATESSMRDQGLTSPLMTMIVCYVILLFMLSA